MLKFIVVLSVLFSATLFSSTDTTISGRKAMKLYNSLDVPAKVEVEDLGHGFKYLISTKADAKVSCTMFISYQPGRTSEVTYFCSFPDREE